MIKIVLCDPSNFLKVAETLTRMGIANNKDKVLYQSCNILKKQNQFYIAHFKDMMKLDGKKVDISTEDKIRTLSIAKVLESWGLIEIVECDETLEVQNNFRIIKHNQKHEWTLVAKYNIGK